MQLQIKKLCNDVIKGHIDRMNVLCDEGHVRDAESLYGEIREWVIQKENLEILSLEYISGYFADFDKS